MRRWVLVSVIAAAAVSLATSAAWSKPVPTAVAVKDGELWGIMALNGRWKAPPVLKSAFYFNEDGQFYVEDQAGLKGLLDGNGEWLLKPRFASDPVSSGNGLVAAQEGQCWGYVDASAKWVIAPTFDSVSAFDAAGMAQARSGSGYGFINVRGKWVIPPMFDYASDFDGKVAIARLVRGGKYGIINRAGKWVTRPAFDDGLPFSEGLAPVQLNGKYGYVNQAGRLAFTLQLDELGMPFGDGLALVTQGGLKGFVNKRGRWAMPPILQEARFPSGGLAAAKLAGKWGFINSSGRWVLPAKFDWVGQFDDGAPETSAMLNGTRGFINRVGQFNSDAIGGVPPKDRSEFKAAGWASAKFKGLAGVISSKGVWLIRPQYACVDYCSTEGDPPPLVRTSEVQATCMAPRKD